MPISREFISESLPPSENLESFGVEELGSFSEMSNVKTVFQTDGGMPTRHGR